MLDAEALRIVRPALEFQETFLTYLEAFERAGEAYHERTAEAARRDFQAYIDTLQRQARGINNENGFNREQAYWLLHPEGLMIANTRLRHPITESVEKAQGHVGMSVHPGFRRQGYASYMAGFVREEAVGMGMDHLTLLTAKTNLASRGLIAKLDGKLIEEYADEVTGETICQYRIDLT